MSHPLHQNVTIQIRVLLRDHAVTAIFLLLTTSVSYIILTSLYRRHHIRAFGSLAPSVPSYLPFGLDIIYRNVKCSRKNEELKFWSWLFAQSPHKGSPTVEASLVCQRTIFTADPENIKAILATQFQDYGKGRAFHDDWKDFLGNGIFNIDGELWHANRQLLRPQFAKERISDLVLFEKHVQKLMEALGDNGREIDVAEQFYRYTLDVATDYLLGQSAGFLDNPKVDFAMAFSEVQQMQSLIMQLGPLKIFISKIPLRRALGVIDAFVKPFIDQVLNRGMEVGKTASSQDQSLLHALAASGVTDRKVIRDQLVNILLAGRDTTASALSFLFLELSRNPQIVAKLRDEIATKIGMDARPTYQDMKTMPYLRNAIQEALRLYPVVPHNVRWSLQDTTLPTGGGPDGKQPIGVPKNTPIAYSTLYLHRREDLYPAGTPPTQDFNPARWENWIAKPWHYIPFNGGPRICLGQQFALTEISYTVIRVLQRYKRIINFSSVETPRIRGKVVLSPVDGVKVGFVEA